MESSLRHTLAAHIRQDRERGLFAAWGRSSVIDEHVGGPVLPGPTVRALHRLAGMDAGSASEGNAGLLHSYGYLLSTVQTSFGLKRARWLDGALAAALGVETAHFLPGGGTGTLLSRVTDATDSVLGSERQGPARLAERTEVQPGWRARTVIARASGSGPAALAYALDQGTGERFLTLFPVADPDAVLAEIDAGPARLRFNARIPDLAENTPS